MTARELDLSGIDAAMELLERSTYDSTQAQMETADAVRQTAESVANVPAWYRTELARFNEAAPCAWAEALWPARHRN